jgi:hypothetical protein
MKGPSKNAERASIGIIFLAILAVISALLPIVVAVILVNLYEADILNMDTNIQLIILIIGIIVLVVIDIFMTVRTVGLRKFEPK